MKYLLDTHTFLWSLFDEKQLGKNAFSILSKPSNRCFLSVVSIWELSIKIRLEKVEFKGFNVEETKKYCRILGISLLPLDLESISKNTYLQLKSNHRDPFDRLIISTALTHDFTVLSCDNKFEQYREDGLHLLW